MSDIKNKKSLELKIYIFIVTKALKAFACPMFVNIFILRPFFLRHFTFPLFKTFTKNALNKPTF